MNQFLTGQIFQVKGTHKHYKFKQNLQPRELEHGSIYEENPSDSTQSKFLGKVYSIDLDKFKITTVVMGTATETTILFTNCIFNK